MRRPIHTVAVILLILIFSNTSAAIDDTRLHLTTIQSDPLLGINLHEDKFSQFIKNVDISLQLRKDAHELFKRLDNKLSGNGHLTASNQQSIQLDLSKYRNNRERLEEIITDYRVYSEPDLSIVFPSNKQSGLAGRVGDSTKEPGFELRINPDDELGRLMILEIKTWTAAKTIIFDNYVVELVRYLKGSDLRRQFDLWAIDPTGKQFLDEIGGEITNDDKYERTKRMILLVQRILHHEEAVSQPALLITKDNLYLNKLLKESYSFQRIQELTYGEELEIEVAFLGNSFFDYVVNITDETTGLLSEMFGNTIGLYEERKGKLYSMDKASQSLITNNLKPLDILFEKTPFRLTDLFIPGHWGHVAIWVGGEKDIPELKRLGVWQELPGIEAEARDRYGYEGPAFQQLVRGDNSVLEALRSGVELNTFEQFLNVDDLAVIRNISFTDDQKRRFLLRAFQQLGKEYDFNFDIENNHSIVCSELIFVAFSDYDWPVSQNFGRYNVSPDHVAALALPDSEVFSPVLLYHDGLKLPKYKNLYNFSRLLEQDYQNIVFQ